MRLSLKFFVKSLLVVTVLLLMLPILLNRLDNQEEESARLTVKRVKRIDRRHESENDKLAVPANDRQQEPPFKMEEGEEPDHQGAPQGIGAGGGGDWQKAEQPGDNNNSDDGSPVGFTKYKIGPKAVYKDGILGNFEPRNIQPRVGPGEGGSAVYTGLSEKNAADISVQAYGFNMIASDKVAMDRTIPDTRMDECKYWHYPEKMPNASVIIVFHNEGWSTLMRTVHSVINMSPEHLLHEVVMVDDYSEKPHLKSQLDEYIKHFHGKVKLFRNKERLGLIETRTLGAKYATGEVIVFLDAHCECNRNWLPPLLERIAHDRHKMAVPIIDGIDWNTFRYYPVYHGGEHFRGIFEWGFLYKESHVPQKELSKRQHNSEPYNSPTHAGGLFAMDRNWFFELGAYDEGMQIWGGENFELSFKLWQCGGSIDWVPCSRVGHVYRNHMPYGFGNLSPKIPIILINYMRVVEVWLDDEFKEYFYTREPTVRGYPIGDITKKKEFREKHKCKSFKWFMENVAYEVYDKFPPPPPNKAWGEIKQKNGIYCWDTLSQGVGGGSIGVSPCHHYGGNQMFRLNTEGQLAVGERCVDASSSGVGIHFCTPGKSTGPWDLDKSTGLFKHTGQGLCIQTNRNNHLQLATCDATTPGQQWEVNNIHPWK